MHNESSKKSRRLSASQFPEGLAKGEVRPVFLCRQCGDPAQSEIDFMSHLVECGTTFISPNELFALEE